jgi:hypothetical protein
VADEFPFPLVIGERQAAAGAAGQEPALGADKRRRVTAAVEKEDNGLAASQPVPDLPSETGEMSPRPGRATTVTASWARPVPSRERPPSSPGRTSRRGAPRFRDEDGPAPLSVGRPPDVMASLLEIGLVLLLVADDEPSPVGAKSAGSRRRPHQPPPPPLALPARPGQAARTTAAPRPASFPGRASAGERYLEMKGPGPRGQGSGG